MENQVVKNAMMICVGRKDWNFPKHILMETDGKHGEKLDDIARIAFEKYKNEQHDEELWLVTYDNYGDVEVMC